MVEDDIAAALLDPEFVASLEEFDAAEARGEPEPDYSTEEAWTYIEKQRRWRSGAST